MTNRLPQLFLVAVALSTALPACRCSPPTPSPVTVRVKNGGRDPIFLDDTSARLGVTIQRQVNGAWSSFEEDPCPCRTCSRVCDAQCSCPDAGVPWIRRLASDEGAERVWSGVVQVSDLATCRAPEGCLSPENAPLDEAFNAQLCYATQVPGFGSPDGGRAPGDLPRVGVTCVNREFRPADGVVELGPERGAACAVSADCRGVGELCFSGSCTAGCPANDFPFLGSNWSLLVASPDDRGFFAVTRTGSTTIYAGTGRLTSVVFQGSSMVLQLTRTGTSGEPLNATLSVGLPPGTGAPLAPQNAVTVKLIDAASSENSGARALALWGAQGQLLFAADVGQRAFLLTPTDIAPFSVTSEGVPVGCRIDECGKLLHFQTVFSGAGVSVVLEPGKAASANSSVGTFRFLSVFNGAYSGTTRCTLTDIRPWALWRMP